MLYYLALTLIISREFLLGFNFIELLVEFGPDWMESYIREGYWDWIIKVEKGSISSSSIKTDFSKWDIKLGEANEIFVEEKEKTKGHLAGKKIWSKKGIREEGNFVFYIFICNYILIFYQVTVVNLRWLIWRTNNILVRRVEGDIRNTQQKREK